MLLGDKCGAHTFPYLEVLNNQFRIAGVVEHGKGARRFFPIQTLQDLIGAQGKASVFYVKLDDAKNAEAESNTDQIIRAGRMEAQKKGDVPGKLGAFLKEFGKPRIDYRPVHLRPLTNDVQAFPPKARVY